MRGKKIFRRVAAKRTMSAALQPKAVRQTICLANFINWGIDMKKTDNYSLPQWEKQDFIKMEDFNDLTQKTDAALKANADATATGLNAETAARSEADAALSKNLGAAGHNCRVTERSGVGDHGNLNGPEQKLGNQLTGSRSVEVNTLDVLQNVGLLSDLSNMQRPVSTGELAVLVVTDSAEDHREDFVARDVAGWLEGTVLITLENTHIIEDGDSFSVIFVDLLAGLEGVGADGQRQSHDQSQHHCE